MSKISGDYKAAIKFIFDREHFGIKLGLENIGNFLADIGRPQNDFPSVHIAGTNGKGSTAAYIEAIMSRAGYRTGIFTSPHLSDFRERIRVGGKKISPRFITDFVNRHRRLIVGNNITFFEVCTALAFSYFARKKVALALVEVGLGGRLDATNTLRPLLTVISDISFDHTNILGTTLRRIAREKAGIIKKDIPVLVGTMKPEPRREIAAVSRRRGAPMIYQRPGYIINGPRLFQFQYRHNGYEMNNLVSSLPGRHQIRNAGLAVHAVNILGECGFAVGRRDIRLGLKNTVWPGRFEIIKQPGKPLIILDVGHNQAGVKATADCFREMFPGRKAAFLIGFVRFKNLKEIVRPLIPLAESIAIARLDTYRSTDPEEVAACFPAGKFPVTISESLTMAAKKLIKSAAPDDIIIIGGSHFAVGEFLANRRKIL